MRTLQDNLIRLSSRLRSHLRTPARKSGGTAVTTDVVIVSYPKTGRTWLRMMLGHYLCEQYSLDHSDVLDTPQLTVQAGIRSASFSHDQSNLRKMHSWRALPTNKAAFRQKRVLLLTRSIEDTMVSAFFQVSKRLGIYDGTISEMLRDERVGVRKFLTFYETWFMNQHVPREFVEMSYEDLHTNPADCLAKALVLLGEEHPDHDGVKRAADRSSFENMQRMEKTQVLSQQAMRPTDPTDADTHKVRRGVVGGYTDYLSPEDIDYIRSLARETDCPFVRTAESVC